MIQKLYYTIPILKKNHYPDDYDIESAKMNWVGNYTQVLVYHLLVGMPI